METGQAKQNILQLPHEQYIGWFEQTTVKLGDGVVTMIKDITQQKHNEQEIAQLKTELAQITTSQTDLLHLKDEVAQNSEERQAFLQKLSESEERLSLAIEIGEMASWDWDMHSNIVTWNDRHF